MFTQAKLVASACALWNFVCVHNPPDIEQCLQHTDDKLINGGHTDCPILSEFLGYSISPSEKIQADAHCDVIANELW